MFAVGNGAEPQWGKIYVKILQQTPPSPTIRLLLGIAALTAGAWFTLALSAYVGFKSLVNSSVDISHSANRLEAALALQAAILRLQKETREFIINPNPQQLSEYQEQGQQIERELNHLREVAQEEPLLRSQVEALEFLAQEKQAQSDDFIEQVQQLGPEAATRTTLQGPLFIRANQTDFELQSLISTIQTRELLLQGQEEATLQRSLVITSATMACGALLGILTLGGSVWIAIGEIRRRLEAERLAHGANLELASALDSTTEQSCLLEDRPDLNAQINYYLEAVERIKNPGGDSGAE